MPDELRPDRSGVFLKVSLALAALLAGGGIGFYYGIFLPAQDLRRQAQEMAAKQAEAEERRQALAMQAQRVAAAQAEYDQCVGLAEQSYRDRWSQSCRVLHDSDKSVVADCADDLLSSESGCRAEHPVRPAQDCALPATMARELTQARDARKAECSARLQAAQAASGA